MATGLMNGSRNSCQEKVSISQKGADRMNKERGGYRNIFYVRSWGFAMIECRECFGESECSLFHF